MRTIFLAGVAMAMGVPAAAAPSAAVPAAPTYLLTMKLSDGDRVIGSPRLKVRAGEAARIDIGEADGSHYKLKVTMTPQAGDTVEVSSAIDIALAGRAHRSLTPGLRVTLGTPSAIAFGADNATEKPFRVDFTVDRVIG